MSQFYTTNENDVRRCREAVIDRMPITITVTVGDKIKMFEGVVQSIEEDKESKIKRWRVTMLD